MRGSVLDRFNAKWTKDGDCWRWLAAFNGPYGRMSVGGRKQKYAHVVSYELRHGPKPFGLDIDHLCRNMWCVNPDHLEAVTELENIRRSRHPSIVASKSGFCMKGHPRSESLMTNEGYVSQCRMCRRERQRWRYHNDPVFRAREMDRASVRRSRKVLSS